MASIRSITVTVRMSDGELRAGLEMRAVTEKDGYDLAEMIDFAKHRGLYDEETRILEFNGLCGYNLFWCGLGVKDRAAFEEIPQGNWANSRWVVLFMSNPWRDAAEQDDLSETCLCQDDYSCQICRLQKRVRTAEFELLELQQITATHTERAAGSTRKNEQDKKMSKKSQLQDGEQEERQEAEVEEEADHSEGEDFEGNDGAEDEGDSTTALEHMVHRAQTAEVKNEKLLIQIEILKRDNKYLRDKLSKMHKFSSSVMTETTDSAHGSPSTDYLSDGSYNESSHPQHRHGGKVRPGGPARPRGHVKTIRGPTSRKTSEKGGHAGTMRDPEKTTNKRERDMYDEDDGNGDSDSEPPYKRHRSTAPSPDGARNRGKTGQKVGRNTCGPQKLTKRKQWKTSHESESDDYEPGPKARGSGLPRSAGRASVLSQANESIAKAGRRTNNSQASFLDAAGLHSFSSSYKNTLNRPESGNAIGNTKNPSMDNESDDAASDCSHASGSTSFSAAAKLNTTIMENPAQTALSSTAVTGANSGQTAATSRKAKGWTTTELQALIALVRAHRNAPVGPNGEKPEVLHDARLFELMSVQLKAQGIDRSAGACKNEWNRRGRQASGIDNRKIANPDRMATSLQ